MSRRVMVTGLGVVAPAGVGKEDFWANLLAGRSYIDADPEILATKVRSRVLSRAHCFDPESFFVEERDAFLIEEDRFIQFGVAAGMLAMADSGLRMEEEDPHDIGIITATAIGGTPTISRTWEQLTSKGRHPIRYEPLGDYVHHAISSNYPGSVLMQRYGFRGACTALSTGCTAGLDAVGLGFEMIKTGDAEVMICGASEAPHAPISYATLDAIGALSQFAGDPTKASRPFDAERAGFVLGEGAALLVLESAEHARARGAHVYAEMRSFASGSNAFHMSDLPPDGKPMVKVIEDALRQAGLRREHIGYINAHGSSTPMNDVFETNSYKEVFGALAYRIPISATKGMIGHSLSSASVMGAAAALAAIELSRIHPTVSYEHPDPQCDLDYVTEGERKADVQAALVTASGFGGIHSTAIFAKPDVSHV